MRWNLGELALGLTAKLNVLLDVSLILGAAILAGQLSGRQVSLTARGCWLAIALSTVWTVAALILRYYDGWARSSPLEDAAMASLLVLGIGVALPIVEPHRILDPVALTRSAYLVAILWPSLLTLRLLVFRKLAPPVEDAELEEVLIIGTGPLGRATGEDLKRAGHRLIGYLELANETAYPRLPADVLGTVDQLDALMRRFPISEVYIAAMAQKHGDAMQEAISVLERFGAPFALPAYEFRFHRASGSAFSADGYVHYTCVESKPHQRAAKRLFDICASGVALLLLSPFLVAVSVAIKLTSKGPIFFKQVRSGLYGHPFEMLKFRSMRIDAEAMQARLLAQNEQAGPVFKIKNDPRVTPVGRFIRKYSIDELPQLINVLRGEMSVVGPRPPVPSEVKKYESWQRRRLSVRPGLTCIWQVSGRNQISFEDWMMLDMEYIDHWSLWTDLSLVLRTVPVVLTGKGAS